MSEPFTLYKLIILYMLQKVDFPLTNSRSQNLFWTADIPPISRFSLSFLNWLKAT